MKIATFNVNGVNGRLAQVVEWLKESAPDVVCLQELKTEDRAFPEGVLQDAGYGSIWHGQKAWNGVAILAAGAKPVEIRRGLPGGREDDQSRYLEAAVNGVIVGCLYAPNGNPQPGPKFEYKLKWLQRLRKHARSLLAHGHPVVLAGDFNIIPTDFDVYSPASWQGDALFHPKCQDAYTKLLAQGWKDALRDLHPKERIYTFWDYFRNHWSRNAGLRIDHLLLGPRLKPKSAGVDKWVRGKPHASDHAPAWVEIRKSRPRHASGRD
ncbi:MAG TPA: exodeoxyribonuclease III [Verrucomicrobiales bacterium]|jgi:exodeoxyribonuclease-3|nr:exodeoxyribonuclease III [Verrucomicrobiales bacterium]